MKENYIIAAFRETVAQRFPEQGIELNRLLDERLSRLRSMHLNASKEKQFHLESQMVPGIAAYETLQTVMPKDEALQTVHGYVAEHAWTMRKTILKLYSASRGKALGDFSFRGQECLQSAVKSSAGWCLSFLNTATVPAIPYLEKNYYCDASLEPVAYGSVSTEHSVMCSNFAVDGDEITMLRRLLTELYPHSSFSVVSDSYDYWNLVDNILPQLHDEIMAHDGCLLIRGDSGNPVEIVTQTVYHLWEQFGGTINSKGYKVLDSHVKAIYGDSITIQRCEAIYKELEAHGFAACNVALGVGSFSMQCIEQDGILKPFTRDTFGMAVKATHGVIDGKEVNIFKDPKTDTDHFKKSLKGLCVVFDDQQDGRIRVKDEMNQKTKNLYRSADMLQPVFRNGKMMRRQTLSDIRNRLNLEGI